MKPIFFILLIIGIPALLGIIYIFIRGSSGLRRYTLTRIGLTLPMVFILATMVFLILRVSPWRPGLFCSGSQRDARDDPAHPATAWSE